MTLRSIAAVALAGLLGACTTPSEDGLSPRQAAAETIANDPRVGEEVNRICFTRGINGFSNYSTDNALILNEGVRDRYLVTFAGVCSSARGAVTVGLDQGFVGSTCLRRGDRIIVSRSLSPSRADSPFDTERCAIDEIYAFDRDAPEEQ